VCLFALSYPQEKQDSPLPQVTQSKEPNTPPILPPSVVEELQRVE